MAGYQANQAQDAALKSGLAKLTDREKSAIAAKVMSSQKVRKNLTYYSKVRFQFALSGAGPFVYTMNQGTKVTAFTYGIGDAANTQNSGFAAGFVATEAETNLLSGASTGGKQIRIHGISLYLVEGSEIELAKLLWANVYADVTTDGQNRLFLLGPLGRIPGGGGLEGSNARSLLAEPPIAQNYAGVGNVNNGQPHAGNFLPLQEPVDWNPAGKQDSSFAVRFTVARTIAFTTTLAADRAAAAGVAAWTHPAAAALGTYVDVTVCLKAVEKVDRSTQA